MTRKEAYSYIKENNLGELVEELLHCNYTRCKTEALEKFINQYEESTSPVEPSDVQETAEDCSIEQLDELTASYIQLVANLRKKNILLASEMSSLLANLQ